MCASCDAPEVLAEALERSNELGLVLSYHRVHDVLSEWGAALEFQKIEKVGGQRGSYHILQDFRYTVSWTVPLK